MVVGLMQRRLRAVAKGAHAWLPCDDPRVPRALALVAALLQDFNVPIGVGQPPPRRCAGLPSDGLRVVWVVARVVGIALIVRGDFVLTEDAAEYFSVHKAFDRQLARWPLFLHVALRSCQQLRRR